MELRPVSHSCHQPLMPVEIQGVVTRPELESIVGLGHPENTYHPGPNRIRIAAMPSRDPNAVSQLHDKNPKSRGEGGSAQRWSRASRKCLREEKVESNAEYRIRRATPDDAGQLARLRLDFRTEGIAAAEDQSAFLKRCREWMNVRLEPASPWRCWVADSNSALIGTLWLQVIEKLPNPVREPELHGYISSVYVVPDRRNLGVGTALLRSCLQESDRMRLDVVFLWSTTASRPLYRRCGFEVGNDLYSRR